MGDGVVDAALMVDVQGGSDQIHERGPELAERTDGTLTVFDGSGVAAGHRDGRPEVEALVDQRQRRQLRARRAGMMVPSSSGASATKSR